MKTIQKVLMLLSLLLVPSFAFAQQYTLTQTTLSAKVGANTNTVQVASATNITVQNNTNYTDIYVDRELMGVTAVNGTVLTVTRGQGGTQASAHASGDMVLSGRPPAFINYDPEGVCSTTAPLSPPENVPAQPTINTRTGNQWLCSSVTGTWVPGFVNVYGSTQNAPTLLVASTAGLVTPTGPLFHINGTSAITGFNIPTGCNATAVGSCSFTVIPDAAFTWTTANNIAVSGTAVANLAIIFIWDATTSKFVQIQSK